MNKQRAGWGMVVLAAILFLAQVVPTLARPHPPGATARVQAKATPSTPEPRASPPAATTYELLEGRGTTPRLLVDRVGDGVVAQVLSAAGDLDGHVRFHARSTQADRGRSQSPDGTIVLDDTIITGRGESADLAALGSPGRLAKFTWRDDSGGACALDGDASDGTYLVTFTFARGRLGPISTRRLPLPRDVAYAGQIGPTILACSGVRGTAVVSRTNLARAASVVEVDLATGAVRAQRDVGEAVSDLVASADGSLLAVNGGVRGIGSGTGAAQTVITELRTGRLKLALDGSQQVRAFTTGNQEVLVSPFIQGGASLLSVTGGATRWVDGSDRLLVGWQPLPGSSSIAVALATRRLETCDKGEPGKFPQFCQLELLRDLLVVPGAGGPAVPLGKGVAIWASGAA